MSIFLFGLTEEAVGSLFLSLPLSLSVSLYVLLTRFEMRTADSTSVDKENNRQTNNWAMRISVLCECGVDQRTRFRYCYEHPKPI